MRNLSSSELSQVSGGRRAQSPMLEGATHNTTLQPAEENFWLGSFGSVFSASFATSYYTPFVPGSQLSIGVVSTPSTGNFGLYAQGGRAIGALTYAPATGVYSGHFTDTFSNGAIIDVSVSSNHTVSAAVKIPLH